MGCQFPHHENHYVITFVSDILQVGYLLLVLCCPTTTKSYFNVIVKMLLMIGLVLFMVFNATYNNIPVISWQTVLLVEKTGEPR